MKQVKKLSLIILLSIIVPLGISFAHPGRTDSSGCHTCRTNCTSWGLSYGEYHCHRSKGVTQPKEPIKSHYGENGTGTTEAAPEYKCPVSATYDLASKACKCNSGYEFKNNNCVKIETKVVKENSFVRFFKNLFNYK
ncbi:YHYH domain-containing protein [bacterium]|jgi:hypothetical protein|nr:YHYH domain-containing protein [bacterium]